jgi:hypothetical protein
MDASDTPDGATDSATEARIRVTPPLPDDNERVTGRFHYEVPEDFVATGVLSRTWRGLAITQLTVEPWGEMDDEPGHITSKLLRRIPTGAIIAAAQSAGLAGPEAEAVPARIEKRQPGRQPLSDDLLRDIAEAYLRETAPGMPRGSITRLAEQYGKPKPMIARWVMRARGDGWLGPAAPGREGGEPGPRLLAARNPDPLTRESRRSLIREQLENVKDMLDVMGGGPLPDRPPARDRAETRGDGK